MAVHARLLGKKDLEWCKAHQRPEEGSIYYMISKPQPSQQCMYWKRDLTTCNHATSKLVAVRTSKRGTII